MSSDAPMVHALSPEEDPAVRLRESIAAGSIERRPGLYVFVQVGSDGSIGHALLVAAPGQRAIPQRWVEHARRGPSPGGWSDAGDGSDEALRPWKARHEQVLDRILIDHCKRAWRLDHDAPYIVEFPPLVLDACGIEPPHAG